MVIHQMVQQGTGLVFPDCLPFRSHYGVVKLQFRDVAFPSRIPEIGILHSAHAHCLVTVVTSGNVKVDLEVEELLEGVAN